ncbi:MAG: ABC transporter permease [Acidobacteriota bacterium]
MDEIRQGLRSGLRLIFKRPGFCALIAGTLALGIGASSVIFSVIDAVLLRPLPFPQPGRLVVMHETLPDFGDAGTSYNTFAHWRERGTAFEGVAAVNSFESNLESGEAPERIAGASVSSDYFAVMGLAALEGRTLEPQDFRPGAESVVLISRRLRQRRFAGQPVIGQTLRLDGQVFTIAGVMPTAHRNPTLGWRDFWRPMAVQNEAEARSWRWRYLDVVARLKPDASLEQARSDIEAVSRGLEEEFPAINQNYGAALHSLDQEVAGESRPTS